MAFSATFFISSLLVSAPAAIAPKYLLISVATFVARAFALACLASAILMSFSPSFINTPFSASVAIFIVALPPDSKPVVSFVN
ncbi:hypothetical protein [Campylobacter hyointestinalis]|uniref:Uncharacterized protein n=1 Tax=Campylobacter hyointestinalis subsp. hyointestinalis TaxID=91352 RepID=A0A855NFK6_CAMHY|nr:hypothetical protein [Campylobacter hyointestinalis]PPB72362.1 hypothetical protein CDQ78_02050 [Campylobacter hyointestinalis subsp. hyointestinalis]